MKIVHSKAEAVKQQLWLLKKRNRCSHLWYVEEGEGLITVCGVGHVDSEDKLEEKEGGNKCTLCASSKAVRQQARALPEMDTPPKPNGNVDYPVWLYTPESTAPKDHRDRQVLRLEHSQPTVSEFVRALTVYAGYKGKPDYLVVSPASVKTLEAVMVMAGWSDTPVYTLGGVLRNEVWIPK